jgi:GTP-binding protein HflX
VGEVLFTDTVGFIRRMPEELLTAFRATLEEVREADLLLHVLDASQEGGLERYRVVEELLKGLGVEAPRVLVLSKADRAAPYDLLYLRERLGGVAVSALKGTGLKELREALAEGLLKAGVQPQGLGSVHVKALEARLLGPVDLHLVHPGQAGALP